ncbi:MAG: Gfo/Idh/MocA family oxidoreductase [Candidatus Methylomirabilis oxyfera]|nr:Gfo/Idh/MocA family oxidoreductase [Candidatus Methylomirabilis oxyfera]
MQNGAYPAVAVVGSGYWGRNLVRNFHALGVLRLVCDSNEETLAGLRAQYPDITTTSSFTEILADHTVQGLVIATPACAHASLVRQALLADKDVFVEKPLALTAKDGEALVRLAEQRGRVLMVGHLLWYHPAVLTLKELIDRGELGRLQYVYSQRLNLGRIRREENILWSFAPHDISVILGLVGEMPERVQAQGGYYLHKQIADVTVTSLSFPSGVGAHVFVSWLHPYKEQRLVVIGDRKMAVFNDLEPQDKLLLYPHTIEWRNNLPVPNHKDAERVPIEAVEPLRAECRHFLECVATRAQPRTNGQEALRVLRVLQQCQEALETERGQGLNENGNRVSTVPIDDVFIHPAATVDEDVEIGAGTKIWHHCHLMPQARIGRNCSLGQNVFVGRGVTIGHNVKLQNNVSVFERVTLEDGVFCGPSMVFTNVINPRSEIERKDEFLPTLVKRGTTCGANCTIVCGVTIGQYAFIGAGAVVVKDIPDFALVVGNPAKIIGWMCQCGNRIAFAEEDGAGACQACHRTYQKVGQKVALR